MRALILAAYLLAAILPMLAFSEGRQQSQADHEQMMAMAGHGAHMSSAGSPIDDAQRLLCQQHCLFASKSATTLSSYTYYKTARIECDPLH